MSYTAKVAKQLDYYQRSNFKGISASAPTLDIEDGDMYFNTIDRGLYFYYDGDWFLLHKLPTLALDYFLLESSDFILQEDGSSKIGIE